MKRRFFMQSISALAISPSVPLKAVALPARSAQIASYTPFMQANALAILRNHENLTYAEFIMKTGLNPAQAEAMLKRFAKSGWARQTGVAGIHAPKPQWMKDFANARDAALKPVQNAKEFRLKTKEPAHETPEFSEINRCCEPDAIDADAPQSDGDTIECRDGCEL